MVAPSFSARTTPRGEASPVPRATGAGLCARPSAAPARRRRAPGRRGRGGRGSGGETERRAREAQTGSRERSRSQVVLHPDLAEALAQAEDALTAALGREAKARVKGDGCAVEIAFESPAE